MTPPQDRSAAPRWRGLSRNVVALGVVSLLTDVATEMMYPLLPVFLASVLGASASFIGVIEGAAESTAALLKLASGWWSDRMRTRKPLVLLGYGISSFVRPLVAFAGSAWVVLAIRVSDRIGKGIRGAPRDALIAESAGAGARGRAFGFHRAMDNAGALIGPLIAFAIVEWWHRPLRRVFLLTFIPGLLAFLVLLFLVRDAPVDRAAQQPVSTGTAARGITTGAPLPRRFWAYLSVLLLFTLGNSTDAFLLLRSAQLGVPVALAPVLWAMFSGVRAVTAMPGGALSDRFGRRPLIIAGWILYAVVYALFALARHAWEAWALFALYGVFYGLTEGTERALVVDLVPAERKGTALGWYNLAIGIGALPASLLFGAVWDRAGAPAAFIMGASLALAAAVGLTVVLPTHVQSET